MRTPALAVVGGSLLAATTASMIGNAHASNTESLYKGPPIRGWSSWNTFAFNASDSLVRSLADYMVENGFKDAGYNYILIDDGWSACKEHFFQQKRVWPLTFSRDFDWTRI
jgi:hypothetical protein